MKLRENEQRVWDRQAKDWFYHIGVRHVPRGYFDDIPFSGITQLIGKALRGMDADDNILDMPSGANPYDYFPSSISPHTVTAVDFSPGMLNLNASHLCLQADMDEPLPIPDATYGAVTSILGMRYAMNIPGTLREFVRVLKPNGSLIIVDIDRSYGPVTFAYGEQSVFSTNNTALFLTGHGVRTQETGILKTGYPPIAFYVGRKESS